MPPRKDDLHRSGEPEQETKTGLRIPVPTRGEFFGPLQKAAKPKGARRKPAKKG